jgi:hypothetical protein
MDFSEKRARIMRRFRLAAAGFFVSLSLAAVDAAAHKAPPPASGCRSVWVTAPSFEGKPSSRSRKRLDFSAAEAPDLEFQVVIPADAALAGRRLELKLFTPKGHLYQTLAVTAGAGGENPGRRKARHRTVTARLPVAGTTIVDNSLYGTWRVEAYFEGERAACTGARSFVIKP